MVVKKVIGIHNRCHLLNKVCRSSLLANGQKRKFEIDMGPIPSCSPCRETYILRFLDAGHHFEYFKSSIKVRFPAILVLERRLSLHLHRFLLLVEQWDRGARFGRNVSGSITFRRMDEIMLYYARQHSCWSIIFIISYCWDQSQLLFRRRSCGHEVRNGVLHSVCSATRNGPYANHRAGL